MVSIDSSVRGRGKWEGNKLDRVHSVHLLYTCGCHTLSAQLIKIMENNGRSWKIMEDHGRSRKIMEDYGRSWKIMEDYGRSWKIMEDQGRGAFSQMI